MEQATISQQPVPDQDSLVRTKNKLGVYILVGVVLVALVALLTSITGTRADFSSLRSHGVPTDDKSLKEAFPKNGVNAASMYDAAFDHIRGVRQGDVKVLSAVFYSANYDSDLTERLIASSNELHGVAGELSRASRLDRCVYSQPVFATPNADNRYSRPVYGYEELSDAAQFLGGMAVISLLKHEPDHGIAYLANAKGVVAQLSKNPGSESFRAWEDTADIYFQAWSTFAKVAADDPKVLEQLVPVSSSLPMANIKQVAAGDFADNLVIYEKAQKDPNDYKLLMIRRFDDQITDFKPFMRQGVNEVIHQWRTVFESLPDQSDDWQACKNVFQQASDDFQSRFPAKDVLLNPFKEYLIRCDDYAVVLAQQRVMQTASQVLAIRARTGRVPQNLPGEWKEATDPCTGEPLVYYKEGKGFKLYSVGPDGRDDSLRAIPRRLQDDIVFELEDPRMRPEIPMSPELVQLSMQSRERERAANIRAAHQLGLKTQP